MPMSPTDIYDLGREAYIQGLRKRHCPFPHSQQRAWWLRGLIQEHNDQEDVLTMLKKGASQ